ncbi:VOC family protein [Roseibium sp. Sym1]|uniref:VOC family protein n=1 Tax=Roseibium sp. Sym1 TaxID=3016006 RepID=UPI0022B2AD4B|nr:VOC family protein [Roseibium sp. Sym1]
MPLSFITLHARDIEVTASFYRPLGLDFVEERHGSGPLHLASETAGLALEIYPAEKVYGDGVLLGFEVEDLKDCRNRLAAAGVTIISDITNRNGFLRFIAQDADGRRVLVSQNSN